MKFHKMFFCPLVYGAQAVSKTAASEANGLGSIPRWAST